MTEHKSSYTKIFISSLGRYQNDTFRASRQNGLSNRTESIGLSLVACVRAHDDKALLKFSGQTQNDLGSKARRLIDHCSWQFLPVHSQLLHSFCRLYLLAR